MAADVKEMYHMLCLPDHDKPALRFVWRDSLKGGPSVYQFERTVFGEVSVPSRANYTKHSLFAIYEDSSSHSQSEVKSSCRI